MSSSTNTSGGGGGRKEATLNGSSTEMKKISVEVAVEKVNDTVGSSSDKAAKRSDEVAAEGSRSGGDGGKKAVWNKATNGAKEVVMGADSWPALSDKGKVPQKSFGEPSKGVTELIVTSLQGSTPVHSPRKQVTSNPHPNSVQSNAHPARQKSFKRHGGNASGNTNSFTQPLLSPTPSNHSPSSSVPSNQNITSSHKVLESGQKGASETLSHGTSDRAQHNDSPRKGTGSHQHGDGSYSHRYGAKKDQDRPSRNWNNQGSVNGRDIHPRPSGGSPRGVIRHMPMPHVPAVYVAPPLSPTMRPFVPHVSYPDFPYYIIPVPPESIRGMSIPYPAPAPHQMFMQYNDPELYLKVKNQIDYYFSNENLVKDIYLRSNMDVEGWVPIELIAGFKQVKKLTNNIVFIMDAIQTSVVVEVKDDKVRRRNDWIKWLIPGSLNVPSQSTNHDPGSSSTLIGRVQEINIDKENADIPSTSSPSSDPSFEHLVR